MVSLGIPDSSFIIITDSENCGPANFSLSLTRLYAALETTTN